MLKAVKQISSLFVAAVALAGGLALATPASAAWEGEIGTRAFANHDLPLYDAWGNSHTQIGELPGGTVLYVDRCSRLWCHIHAGRSRGWVFLYSLSFGQGPNSIFWPPEARHGPFHPWNFLGEY